MARLGRFWRGLVPAMAATAVVGVAAPVSSTGCFGHQCDPSRAELKADDGHLIDADTWESNRINEPWLDYGPQHTIRIPTDKLGGRWPTQILVYVSGNPNPVGSTPQRTFTLATGNLITVQYVSDSAVEVRNDTCAQYYARVVIKAGDPLGDAGADAK